MQANGALQASPARAHQEKEYTLREAVDILLEAKTGGFTAVATSVDGADKLDPAKSARRQMFLTEDRNAAARLRLRNRLTAWRDLLSKSDNPGEMAETCRETVQKSAALLLRNLREAVRAGKNLERAYRNLDLFFKNAGKASIRNLTLMNASPEQLRNLSSPRFIHAVRDELTARFDKLDLRGNYSLLVVPGYLGSKKVLNYWAEFVHQNKVFLLTDYRNLDDAIETYETFCDENLATADDKLANVIMPCNYLLGRPAYREEQNAAKDEAPKDWRENIGEDEALWIGPAGALAGRMYRINMAQVAAGKKWGQFQGVETVRFDLAKSQLSEMVKANMVPMVFEWKQVSAFSDRTLFTGEPVGLQTYSVVRVFDWVMKVLMDFGNRIYGENLSDFEIETVLRPQVVRFLDKLQHDWRFVQGWRNLVLRRNPKNRKQILIYVCLDPLWPTETVLITLDGMQGDDGETVIYQSGVKTESKK